MNTKTIKAGIIGAAGYTGGELIRLLLLHPQAEIVFAQSKSNSGKAIHAVHKDLVGETNLVFSEGYSNEADVLFLCMAHGESAKWLQENKLADHIRIIDLSQDFRIKAAANDFVYGLPELNRDAITQAKHIANPGCFATAIQLMLLPFAAEKLLPSQVHVSAVTGSTGAGQSFSETSHFSNRFANHSVYKAFTHQHLAEIGQSLAQQQQDIPQIHFIPQRGAFTRGIHASAYFECSINQSELDALLESFYSTHPFTIATKEPVELKQVVNTNRCLLHGEIQNGLVLMTAVIDNLLKGASGQAVQNMNLIFGLPEKTGLQLKANVF